MYVLLLVIYWLVLYRPVMGSLDGLKTTQRQLLQQSRMIEDRVQNKEAAEAELQQLMLELKQALQELPEGREIPNLLKGISTLGKKVGLEVRKFQPLSEIQHEFVAEVPVALEVNGSFHEVAMFFDRLSKMNRIVYVQDIQMSEPEDIGGKVTLSVTGNAVTFRFLSEEEIGEQEAPAGGRGKRGKRGKQ